MADTALYVRGRDRGTIHRMDGCRASRLPSAIEWHWAEGMTPATIRYHLAIRRINLHWCRRCFPTKDETP